MFIFFNAFKSALLHRPTINNYIAYVICKVIIYHNTTTTWNSHTKVTPYLIPLNHELSKYKEQFYPT